MKNLREILNKMADLDNGQMNDEQREKYAALEREYEQAKRENEADILEAQAREIQPKADVKQMFREQVLKACSEGTKREITFAQFDSTASNTKVSADAEGKTVNAILPTLEKGLIYDKVGLHIQTGVTNKLVWPYAATNVEVAERAEKGAAATKDIDFGNISPLPQEHGIVIKLTNEAIDNTAFDIYSFVLSQLTMAEQRYINKKMFAPAYFTGLKGPFALATAAATNLTAMDGSWKAILNKIATIAAKGYDMSGFAFVCPARTKALLEATPKANGQGGFVCENNTIAGYPVFVSEYAGFYQTSASAQAFNTTEYPLAMGPWNLLALCQHGVSRVTIDATTLAEYNEVRFILHNTYSITDLSKRGNDNAFSIVKLNDVSNVVEATVKA